MCLHLVDKWDDRVRVASRYNLSGGIRKMRLLPESQITQRIQIALCYY